MKLGFCLFLALLGCGERVEPKSPEVTPDYTKRFEPPESEPVVRAATQEEVDASHGKLGGVWATCVHSFEPRGDFEKDFARYTSSCSAPMSLRPATDLKRGSFQSEADVSARYSFRAYKGHCYRAFVLTDSTLSRVQAALVDDDDRVRSVSESNRWTATPPVSAYCVKDDGVYFVEVDPIEGKGDYIVQVWAD